MGQIQNFEFNFADPTAIKIQAGEDLISDEFLPQGLSILLIQNNLSYISFEEVTNDEIEVGFAQVIFSLDGVTAQ